MPNQTVVPAPRVPFIDERTGYISREWYMFLVRVFEITGVGNYSIEDVEKTKQYPDSKGPIDTASQEAQLNSTADNGRVEVLVDEGVQRASLFSVPSLSNIEALIEDLKLQVGTLPQPFIPYLLSELEDIILTSLANNDLLSYDSSKQRWVNRPATSISGTLAYVAKTANYTVSSSDCVVECTANSFTITLLTAVGIQGKFYHIKNTGNGVITIATTSSQTIDGNASGVLKLVQYDNLTVLSNGANWIIL